MFDQVEKRCALFRDKFCIIVCIWGYDLVLDMRSSCWLSKLSTSLGLNVVQAVAVGLWYTRTDEQCGVVQQYLRR